MNIPKIIYVVEVMRPDRDDWLPSRCFDTRAHAEQCVAHHAGSKWVARVVEFARIETPCRVASTGKDTQ